MFKESDHVEFVSAFLYQNLGLNVSADDITVQLSDTSFDKVTFDYDVDIDNLNCMLDLYISELIKHNASYSDSILLKQKIIYFLGVFKNFGFFTFDIRGYSNTLSPVKVIDIVSMIINDCEELSKANSSTDAIRNLYLDKMKVDGKVLVAKFALKQFFHSDFGDFISFVEKRITDCLNETLRIIKAVEHGFVRVGQHKINRRINDDLKLCIDFNTDDYPANMPDIYIKFNDTFDGNGALYCDNDALISLYTDVASIINVPVMMEVRLINKRGRVVCDSSHS
ncbi:hypothetical protein MKT93_004456, partial [Salmonella enterica subsp. enterica]|nr:hypothetical protein [Salmonella enterica subsp. enterica]